MIAAAPIVILAEVDPRERPAVVAGLQQLAEALRAAAGVDWPIQLTFGDLGGAVTATPGDAVVLSLLGDVESDEPLDKVVARWRTRSETLVGQGAEVLVLTAFRAVPERRSEAGQRRLDRIRRLDRMTLDLSHDLGVSVVDIDRAFAHIGARVLGTDYRLSGRVAAEVAGHCLALCLLMLGLDDVIPPDVQERARTHHGALRDINTVVHRRLAAA
jgi:hypothetical protein